ncbi:MAG: hypothetical protein K2K93_05720 [Muribaculaceae bacterium]|nr:hypothetical protein [Muribaculaceae bacterium]
MECRDAPRSIRPLVVRGAFVGPVPEASAPRGQRLHQDAALHPIKPEGRMQRGALIFVR